MPGRAIFLKYWLPVLLWMGVIFIASTELLSGNRTSRIIGPILRWFNPEISAEAIASIQLVVRKCAHIAEYAVLSILTWRAIRKPLAQETRPWSHGEAGRTLAVCVLYAITDEVHQYFVASRFGSAKDVVWDALGAGLGLVLLWILVKRRAGGVEGEVTRL